jgi:hypothetical protein
MRNYSEVSVSQQITKLRGEDATKNAPTDSPTTANGGYSKRG